MTNDIYQQLSVCGLFFDPPDTYSSLIALALTTVGDLQF